MFRRSVPAALLIDFDNVGRYGLADKIPNWTAWLEDGHFEEPRRRRKLVKKRVYWNSQFENLRDEFEANGYDAVMCPSRLRQGKSAVDMIMALDAFEVATRNKEIDEFILLTTDSDFIPLFERLAGMSKSTVTMADPGQKFIFATYSDHADIVIPTFRIAEASKYERRPFKLFTLFRRFPEPPETPPSAPSARAVPKSAGGTPVADPVAKEPTTQPAPKRVPNLEAAAQLVAALAKQSSGSFISRQTITRALERKFGKVQDSNWFGCGNYKAFVTKAASIRRDLVSQGTQGGGVSVRYRNAKRRRKGGAAKPPPAS